MNRQLRDEYRAAFAELLARIADEGGSPMEAAVLFGEAMREKVSESVRASALDAIDRMLTDRARPRRRR